MENNDLKETSNKKEIINKQSKELTNEEKLEYLSKLIQDAEQNLIKDETTKKLIK